MASFILVFIIMRRLLCLFGSYLWHWSFFFDGRRKTLHSVHHFFKMERWLTWEPFEKGSQLVREEQHGWVRRLFWQQHTCSEWPHPNQASGLWETRKNAPDMPTLTLFLENREQGLSTGSIYQVWAVDIYTDIKTPGNIACYGGSVTHVWLVVCLLATIVLLGLRLWWKHARDLRDWCPLSGWRESCMKLVAFWIELQIVAGETWVI